MAKRDTIASSPKRPATKKATASRSAVKSAQTEHRSLYTGLIRWHVLHHAAKGAVYGFAMIGELRRHGYELSTGTLYPILHGLEQKGLLKSAIEREGGFERRVYRATSPGRKALAAAKTKVRELFGELFEQGDRS